MLKGGLVVPGQRAVVAGTGPLLLPVATGLAAAGVEVAALVESADPKAFLRRPLALAAQPGRSPRECATAPNSCDTTSSCSHGTPSSRHTASSGSTP